jgi:uncharacterized protein YbbC (DUF1343 family)
MTMKILLYIVFFTSCIGLYGKVQLGIDCLFQEGHLGQLKGKKIGVITNHTGVNGELKSTAELIKMHATDYTLRALFAPEHGIHGKAYAEENIEDVQDFHGIPVYSLYGKTRRPTDDMLKDIDVLIYDIQDIGCRSYTYATTLYYAMEEAAKRNITIIVCDRPNPINGIIVDGPLLNEEWRSFIGYINVPYCHGMTIGELAKFFNEEYKINCTLKVIPMKGWKRTMSFRETGLSWIPTSPNIPEPDTPLYYATTGILGELNLVNLGGGYSLPFKLIGAPWIDAPLFAQHLNAQKLPGVRFLPFHYRPFFGGHKGIDCQGVMIMITDNQTYRPMAVQYLLLGALKTLYPEKVMTHLASLEEFRKRLFSLANGTDQIFSILSNEKYIAWKLIEFQKEERQEFLEIRKKYLLY